MMFTTENAKIRQQYNYSEFNPFILKDIERRIRLAKRTIEVLKNHLGVLDNLICLDVACSGGAMTYYYAQHFKKVIACDIDRKAVEFAQKNFSRDNIEYHAKDFLSFNLEPLFFDVITCTQAYDHVSDAERLFEKIYALLKPGGVCFFSGRNRFSLIEPNTGLPIVNFIPTKMADLYVRITKKGDIFYEKQRFLAGIRKLVRKFKIHDYTLEIVKRPQAYFLTDKYKDDSVVARLIWLLFKIFYFAIPNYIWVLEK